MNEQEIREFLEKLASGNYTNEEYQAFVHWAEHCSREEYEQMIGHWEQLANAAELYDDIDPALIASIERGLDQIDERKDEQIVPLYPDKKIRLWPRIAAAASIILAISVGGYFVLHKKQAPEQLTKAEAVNIKPGSQKAILKLADGKQIALNEAPVGTLAKQDGATVIKAADGQVIYNGQNSATPTNDTYNTITTQRGGYYPLKMADGTVAILDAASSIKYPVTFNGKERIVEITGQVYFEVAHDAGKPFKVMVKGQTIEDIGTEFNINAYDDEMYISTTLVNGSVRVMRQQKSIVLVPGQEALVDIKKNTLDVRTADVEDIIAWKKGQTSFKNGDIHEIMREVSRWYDVDVQYQGDIPDRKFMGGISRNANLSDLLKILEFNNIHFTVEGKKITIKP
ncbi:FecR family protein [Mucilaginibacter ginsenosidivorans]|uniref:FecR family protein n=1 Tax=Mucilaginibacter ginsenosidivorans TaxID=398053 RepID=A0A5B8UU26_9SPHI|nr:FecR family protein [Mucilaginibacter ginsenosidivorans]QEC62433.1 FecR family protein [Mucilaginibacter ginsenosidivorans]